MKTIQLIGISILLIAFVMVSSQCKKECTDRSNPACDNYDPCYKKVSADFKMGLTLERTRTDIKYFEVDTVYRNFAVEFVANDSTDVSYEWVIGTDPDTLRTRKIEVEFPIAVDVVIHLTVKGKADCAISTTTSKKLVVTDKSMSNILLGTYYGYLVSNKADTFRIAIRDKRGVPYIDGLPKNCERKWGTEYCSETGPFAYRDFGIGDGGTCGSPDCPTLNGWGKLENDNASLQLDFQYETFVGNQIVKDKFIGKKIK
ncbi:MAG: hypothetical protein RLZZ628_510 [Bacteroidota bacterium]|jgi:hypothetical protein